MENASNALLMAATVLLAVMIISVGVVLFRTFGDFSSETAQKMQEKQIAEWNNTYLKYYGETTKGENESEITGPIKVTAHDIVSVINSAKANNEANFGDELSQVTPNENINYVSVKIKDISMNSKNKAETWSENEIINFLKQNTFNNDNSIKYYKCSEIKISSVTGRVYSITFEGI